MPRMKKSSPLRGQPAATTSSCACPGVTIPWWARAAARCPAGKSSAFPSPGPFWKDAPVILLDEATASLDPENEVDVQRAIDTLVQGRTVIAIAHRLKTIMNADRIIVLDNGRVAEQGTHDDLMHADGLYARLWRMQESTAGWKL